MRRKHLALPYIIWMVLFTVVPLFLIIIYAVVRVTPQGDFMLTWDYMSNVFKGESMLVLIRSLEYALITTAICLAIAYPAALILSKFTSKIGAIVNLLVVLPMWMNFLLRTYAWKIVLDPSGIIAKFFELFGTKAPQMLYTEGAVIMGLVYNFIPFMLLPIYSVCSKMNEDYIHAAEDLGANKWQSLWHVTLPLTRPGIITGITMVFMPAVTTFVISRLLGGSHFMMYGDLIETQFMTLKDWNTGAALSVFMMILLIASMAVMRKYDKEGESSAW